ncbi:MAG: hypothetical protein JOZ41_03655 [Chloroflexi bacterium]|nr:hypothetical protein [Chloroflexota bacterium]
MLLLLDGYNLLYRSFVTLPSAITGGDGRPINAVYGMVAAILRLMRELEPARIVAAFDVPEIPTFRHDLYPLYQAQRGPLGGAESEEFLRQVALAQRSLPPLGIAALTYPGYEADDIMGTLASRGAAAEERAVIVSTDKDLLQLVRPGIEVLVPGKAGLHIRDADGVRARLGVHPSGVTTYKALAGDPSDNIPGVPGIGARTAIRLVERYGSLEAIYDDLAGLPARTAAALREARDSAFLFRRLVTIQTDLPLEGDLASLPTPAFTPDAGIRDLLNR